MSSQQLAALRAVAGPRELDETLSCLEGNGSNNTRGESAPCCTAGASCSRHREGETTVERARISELELAYKEVWTAEPVVFYQRRVYLRGLLRIARQAADCRELLGHLGVGRAHVVAHSYGGSIALRLARSALSRGGSSSRRRRVPPGRGRQGYHATIEVLPGASTQTVAAALPWFECELPGLVDSHFGDAEAPVTSTPGP